MKCGLKARLRTSDLVLGTWVTIGHADVPDLLEGAGFDWLVFDSEHAPLGPEVISRMIQVVDPDVVCPLVRVGAADQYSIKMALDMGAHGVVIPMVNSRAEAETAVGFSKYPPAGRRGVAPRKAADYGRSMGEYLRSANEMTTVVAQIETREALQNLDDILSTEGVDVAFVGPTDLTASLGLVDDRGHPRVIDAMKTVVKACERHGTTPGVLAADPEEAKRAVALGFRFIGLGSDTRFLARGARAYLDAVRG